MPALDAAAGVPAFLRRGQQPRGRKRFCCHLVVKKNSTGVEGASVALDHPSWLEEAGAFRQSHATHCLAFSRNLTLPHL